jgi:hypothetical protein
MGVVHDVALVTGWAAAEDHLVREVGRARQADAIKCLSDSGPGVRVGPVAGGLVADVAKGPCLPVSGEADLARGEDVLVGGAVSVLAAAGREPPVTVQDE